MFNQQLILNIFGILLRINGLMMVLALTVSLMTKSGDHIAILVSAAICYGTGYALKFKTRHNSNNNLSRKDGYLIVTFGWLIMSLTGCLPYLMSGAIPSLTDAFFESISGYTTTGASVINNLEAMPKGVLFWRSLTQWIGGMGIIVLTIAILPILKIGGMELFMAESPGPTSNKLHPRITETAKRLYALYVSLTIVLAVLLKIGGMNFFDSVNHALTTMATGGFSTKQNSIAFYPSAFIQYTIIVFMLLAGTNFSLIYFGVKGKFKTVFTSEEFRTYVASILLLTLIVFVGILEYNSAGFESNIRDALFQVVSIVTTTGFSTADYTQWIPIMSLLFFLMMFSGGSAGSTSGGIKTIRHLLLFKNSLQEFRRILHPKAVLPVHIDSKPVSPKIVTNVQAFFLTYIFVFLLGVVIMMLLKMDLVTALGIVATSIGNVGPGIGELGPSNTFHAVPNAGKWVLGLLMLVGRLELFTVLLILTPFFWKKD